MRKLTPSSKLYTAEMFAEFGFRMFAVALDFCAVIFLSLGVQIYILEAAGLFVTDSRPIMLIVAFLYFSASWSSPLRATPVQFILGMRVVSEDGTRLGFPRAVLRSILLIGLIVATMTTFNVFSMRYLFIIAITGYALVYLAAITINRQAGHDLLARTLVVHKAALSSPVRLQQLREHVSDKELDKRKRRGPSIWSMAGNLLVLAIPAYLLIAMAQMQNHREVRARTAYALQNVAHLKIAVESYYEEYEKWPMIDSEIGTDTRGNYPDGGYYELEDDGVIRIRFTVLSQLKKGSLFLRPTVSNDAMTWECHSEGDIARGHVPAACRNN